MQEYEFSLGVQNIHLEGDSLRVISSIHYQKKDPSPAGATDSFHMRQESNMHTHSTISHVSRSCNQIAHSLV